MQAIIDSTLFEQWWLDCLNVTQALTAQQKKYYHFGEAIFAIHFYHDDSCFFTQAIAHVELTVNDTHDFQIDVIDGSIAKLPTWFITQHLTTLISHHFTVSDNQRFILHYQKNTQVIQFIDLASNRAVVWYAALSLLPAWERSFPFRQILHHYFENTDYCLIHGAAVGIKGQGVLLTAKGGSGKSTAALACLSKAWLYAGDDFVLYQTKTNTLYSLYNVAKLTPQQLTRFNGLQALSIAIDNDMDKQQLFLYPPYQSQLIRKLTLTAIIVPRYEASTEMCQLIPITAAHALFCMAPSTLFLLNAKQDSFNKLAHLCKSIPTYQLNTNDQLDGIPLTLQTLLN